MAAKPVQISLDSELLRQIDRDPETKRHGRSAFIRRAVDLYLRAKERQQIDAVIRRAYQGETDAPLDEITDLIGSQAWPEE